MTTPPIPAFLREMSDERRKRLLEDFRHLDALGRTVSRPIDYDGPEFRRFGDPPRRDPAPHPAEALGYWPDGVEQPAEPPRLVGRVVLNLSERTTVHRDPLDTGHLANGRPAPLPDDIDDAEELTPQQIADVATCALVTDRVYRAVRGWYHRDTCAHLVEETLTQIYYVLAREGAINLPRIGRLVRQDDGRIALELETSV